MEFKKDELQGQSIDLVNRYISVGHQMLDVKREFLEKYGVTDLTLHEVRAIRYIGQLKNPSMTSLAHTMNITVSSLTPIVQRLERKDYVIREKDKADRRISYVSLTEKGKHAEDVSMKHIKDLITRIAKEVTKDEFKAFVHILSLMESASIDIANDEALQKAVE